MRKLRWSQELQRAFDVGQDVHELHSVELDRSHGDYAIITGDPAEVERIEAFIHASLKGGYCYNNTEVA